MKELVLILSLLQPKADSICNHIQDRYISTASQYDIHLTKEDIKFELVTTFTDDTLAVVIYETPYVVQIDLGYYISLIDEPGRFATLIYHELSHIYLNKDDVDKGKTIMNYDYIDIDIWSDRDRFQYLYNLFKSK